MIRSFTHKPPYIFLKTATIPTYYGISIAIPRYIAMQISTVPFIMTRIIIALVEKGPNMRHISAGLVLSWH